jgi:hypothetical protein
VRTNEARNIALTHVPADAASAYWTLAGDPKYRHFVRIPERILQCIDYFEIACDRPATIRLLHIYYLFIGVVDDSIDAGEPDSGRKVLEYLSARFPLFDQEVRRSCVRLVTEILKCELNDQTYSLVMKLMWSLHTQVINERAANSMESYINHRNSVGSLTAELSYVLIRPGLGDGHETLCRFMRQVGAVGCLIDSLIDLRADRQVGLLGFTPGVADYGKLIHRVLRDGLRISLKHPGLSRLFLRAVIDNLHDRFRTAKQSRPDVFLPIRKDEAPNAA